MAPSATETITLPQRTASSSVKLTGGVGPYKELAPIGYEKEAEEQGKDGFKAAKVSRADVHYFRPLLINLVPELSPTLGQREIPSS